VCRLADVLASMQVPRDFDYSGRLGADMPWIHRRAGDTDIYFVANRTDGAEDVEARFRVSGKQAELWHPDSGAIEPAGYAIARGPHYRAAALAERESLFVVFRARGVGACAYAAACHQHGPGDRGRPMGREFSAELRGAGEASTGEAGAVDREFG